jgi:recombination protein RecA
MAKFVRKEAPADTIKDDYEVFVEQAKKIKSDIIICGSGKDELSIDNWITMPKEIQGMIGVPGLPCGLITMVYGLPDCGKTTFCNEALASCQREDGISILILTELKYDKKRAGAQGVKVDGTSGSLIIYRPKTIEEVGENIHDISQIITNSKTKKKVCVVWDSLGCTPCANELNEKRADFAMDSARAITGVLRKTQALIKDKNISFTMINQIYSKTGVTFGKKTTTRGGNAPRYYSALCLDFTRLGRIRPKGVDTSFPFCGIKTQIEAEKNHLGAPFRSAVLEIDWKGFVVGREAEYAPEEFASEPSEKISEEEAE